jgi:hypothetical protein
MKKVIAQLPRISTRPKHEKLPWPGLKDKSHLCRVVSRAVKESEEMRETELWARNQIARVLNYVPPETAMRLVLRERHRRRKPMSPISKAILKLLETLDRTGGIRDDGGMSGPQN